MYNHVRKYKDQLKNEKEDMEDDVVGNDCPNNDDSEKGFDVDSVEGFMDLVISYFFLC